MFNMEIAAVDCAIGFFENANGIFNCSRNTTENMQLDWKKSFLLKCR